MLTIIVIIIRVTRVNDSILHLLKSNSAVYSTFMLRHLGASMTWSIFPIFLHDELKLSSIEIR
jgi:hypothetical protein